MSLIELLPSLPLLLGAAFLAGALNAVAGGGSFLTLPALVAVGVPALSANATGTVALLPGYISGAWAFRHDIRPVGGLSLRLVIGVSLVGGATGAALLLVTPDATFRALVPWLLLVGTALFALAPYLTRQRATAADHTPKGRITPMLGLLAVSVYGGYFNGGLGILLLALFSVIGGASLNAMNGLKNWVSAVLTAIAVLLYAGGNLVDWPAAGVMMIAATAGGYIGGRLARKIPAPWLRGFVVCVGLAMTGVFFLKG